MYLFSQSVSMYICIYVFIHSVTIELLLFVRIGGAYKDEQNIAIAQPAWLNG